MGTIKASFRTIPDTGAATGRSDHHVLVVDRPEGNAGGLGLGFNGGELLAMAIGGCLCNDLRYVAHDWGFVIDEVMVDVSLEIGDAGITSVALVIGLSSPEPVDLRALADRAAELSVVLNAVRSGIDVDVRVATESDGNSV